jgi:hypothetical protein
MNFRRCLPAGFLRLFLVCTVVQAVVCSGRAAEQAQTFGLGVILGAPTAISGKMFLGGDRAIDGGLAFAVSDYLLLYGDYLGHFPGAFGNQNAFVSRLSPYVGAGAVVVIITNNSSGRDYDGRYFNRRGDSFALGARIPVGIEWIAPKFPIGVSLEIAPGIVLFPATQAFIQAGLAIRYYF